MARVDEPFGLMCARLWVAVQASSGAWALAWAWVTWAGPAHWGEAITNFITQNGLASNIWFRDVFFPMHLRLCFAPPGTFA